MSPLEKAIASGKAEAERLEAAWRAMPAPNEDSFWSRVLGVGSATKKVIQNGHEFYAVPVHPSLETEVRSLIARERWKEYYRAVRTIRRIREQDQIMCARFSEACWDQKAPTLIDARLKTMKMRKKWGML